MASQEGHKEVVQLLLHSGARAQPDVPNKVSTTNIYTFVISILLVLQSDSNLMLIGDYSVSL